MSNLRVQITNVPIKRAKPTNTKTNVWCTNCQGHGHLPSKCPSIMGNPNNIRPRCSFCGGNHPTDKYWNLASVKQKLREVKQVLQTNAKRP